MHCCFFLFVIVAALASSARKGGVGKLPGDGVGFQKPAAREAAELKLFTPTDEQLTNMSPHIRAIVTAQASEDIRSRGSVPLLGYNAERLQWGTVRLGDQLHQ